MTDAAYQLHGIHKDDGPSTVAGCPPKVGDRIQFRLSAWQPHNPRVLTYEVVRVDYSLDTEYANGFRSIPHVYVKKTGPRMAQVHKK